MRYLSAGFYGLGDIWSCDAARQANYKTCSKVNQSKSKIEPELMCEPMKLQQEEDGVQLSGDYHNQPAISGDWVHILT